MADIPLGVKQANLVQEGWNLKEHVNLHRPHEWIHAPSAIWSRPTYPGRELYSIAFIGIDSDG